jgi:hypothetical protein
MADGGHGEPAGVTCVGRHVRRMMETQREGTVIAAFRRSLYVRDADGAIACIGAAGLGAGPLNALCERWPDKAISVGAATQWRDGTFAVGARWRFDMARAETWAPPPLPPQPDAASGLNILLKIVTADVPARGLGQMISALVDDHSWTTDDPFARAGADGVLALRSWLAAPSGQPPAGVERLIGLGPGLTPTGDDALGGAMIAARACGRADIADVLARWVLLRAKRGTSDISFAHLEAAADGQGAAALHDVLVALARADRVDLVSGLRRLDAIGHSSGWDALAGGVAALTALARG